MTRPTLRHPRPLVARPSFAARLVDGFRMFGDLIVVAWYAAIAVLFFSLASALLRAAGWL